LAGVLAALDGRRLRRRRPPRRPG